MFTAFRRFFGLSTQATREDVHDLVAKLQTSLSQAEVTLHPYLITSVQTFSGHREVTMTCRKTRRRVARVNLAPDQKPDISWGARWS